MPKDSTPKGARPSKTRKSTVPPPFTVRFATVSADEAAQGLKRTSERKNTTLPSRSLASDIQVKELCLTPKQRREIDALNASDAILDAKFYVNGDQEQQSQYAAAALMASHGLDLDSREANGNRWSVRWSTSKDGGKTKRVLLQCDCGYDHREAGSTKRRTAVDFTGCLAHAEITYVLETEKILRIRGYFEHNDACKEALMQRIPALPLHPSVYQTALMQLANGASLTDIQQRNREWVTKGGDGLIAKHGKDWKHRWLLQRHDTRSLYRQFSRLHGVKVSEKPHINLHEWLDPHSRQYNPTLASAVFHYSARTTKEERLEVCVATDEMKEASWKYGHRSQIIVDGTFGVCDKRLLLFIIMGIDENKRGVPLAFLFFSAPTGNQLSSSGYDTDILAKLLKLWRTSLETFRGGQSFYALVAITDTDLKERAALLRVFPGIILLICKFHLRQSWRNHRNKLVKGKSPESMEVKARLRLVEQKLVETTTLDAAVQIIEDERRVLTAWMETSHGAPAERGLLHLEYLSSYWLSFDLWASWSDFGRYTAAEILGCGFDGVLPTTNHLESFNGLLKRKYLRRWQRGGRRLRVDVLIQIIVTRVLPAVFEQRRLQRGEQDRISEWILSLPGGERLLANKKTGHTETPSPIAYFAADPSRDAAAAQLLDNNQISAPTFDAGTFSFSCYSSFATELDENPLVYGVEIRTNGTASCTGPDFTKNGGACKHIRAALLKITELRQQIPDIPLIYLPTSEPEARVLQARLAVHSAAFLPSLARSSALPTLVAAQKIDELLAGDSVAYDDTEGTENEEPEDVDDDNDSVATDASGDADELNVGNFISHNRAGSSTTAVDNQAIARVSYELARHAPKIQELAHCLADVNSVHSDNESEGKCLQCGTSNSTASCESTSRSVIFSAPSACLARETTSRTERFL